MHKLTITDLSMLVVLVSYLTLATALFSWGMQKQEENKYFAYFLYGLAVVSLVIFMPLTIWYLADIGWIHLGPVSNITTVTNLSS